jgi:hypothetical protein
MNSKPKLKVKHKVQDLICFIEKNDLENAKKIIDSSRQVLTKKQMDDKEPIYYAIKYKCDEIFIYILENSEEAKYDVFYI